MIFDSLWIAAIAGIFVFGRICRRTVSRGELVTALVFVLHFLLIQVQLLLDGSPIGYLDWRYHTPEWALLMVLCGGACGVLAVRRGRVFACVLLVVCVVKPAERAIRQLIRNAEVYQTIAMADRWAAEIIRSDWQGASRGLWSYDSREYHTDRLPVIVEHSGYVATLVGGRNAVVTTHRSTRKMSVEELPDYLCGEREYFGSLIEWYMLRGGELVATRTFGGREFVLCRRKPASQ